MKLYDWQEKIVKHEGNLTIRGGRQTGKSWAVAQRIAYLAKKYPGSRHLIIAASERQENYLLEKVVEIIGPNKCNYRGRKTLTKLPLKNNTDIYKYPIGMTGIYVEGMSSVDFLYADEAIHVWSKVWDSIIPMLAEPRNRGLGWITLLSTTRGKPKGFFFDSFERKDFLKVQIKAEDCEHISKEFLKEEKLRLGEEMFGVIYNGEFSQIGHLYFPPELIDRAVKIPFWNMRNFNPHASYYLGIDPARFGKSEAGFAAAEMTEAEKVDVIHTEVLKKSSLLELENKTNELHAQLNFRKIFIDDGGFGAGLMDILEKKFKHRLRALNNKAAGTFGKILKEDLYSNFERLLEQEKVRIINDKKTIEDLKKVEYTSEGKIKGTDLSEAIVRACWCVKEKSIKPRIISF